MGRKLDALLGRSASKIPKLKALLSLTVSRLAILKNQRNARCSFASGDIVVLLQQGHQERAILRAEHVIKEQNMVDVFVILESYCNLLMERSVLLEHNTRECPLELKEAISTLVFMASRSAELLELQDVRSIFASWYGKEFAAAAVELRSGCAVNTKIVLKMSTRQPDLESRLKVVREIASKNGISCLDPKDTITESSTDPYKVAEEKTPKQSLEGSPPKLFHASSAAAPDTEESKVGRGKFLDATSAAQAAFESAAYAADAARAAVELSRQGSNGKRGGSGKMEQAGDQLKESRQGGRGTTSSDSECGESAEQRNGEGVIDDGVAGSSRDLQEDGADIKGGEEKTTKPSSVRRRRRGGS